MAVYTHVDQASLDAFLAAYDLGPPLALEGIAEGVENSNYRLVTERGRYILTLYEKRVDPADLPYFLDLMIHLAARGVPCPTPIRARDGGALQSLCGRPASIVSYLAGASVRRVQAAHCAALGEALARLHLAGADFSGFRPNSLSVASWRGLFEACRGGADQLLPGLAAEIEAELAAGAAAVLTTGARDPWQPAALRGSAGLHFAVPVARAGPLPATDRPLLAIDPDGEPLTAALTMDRAILAFGSERRGLGPALLARAEQRVAIPMREGVSSLNLACAVAVMLYRWRAAQPERGRSQRGA